MIGQTLGRYRIVERLGEGGMGVVFRAEDPRLERDVALKVMKQDALHDEDSKRRFRLEARALSRLLHPNIATLFDFDSDRGVDFLVLEFVPGESLARTLANGPLPETRARAIALDVAEGLQSAHEKGIVHRDLKPGNIIITPRGRAKVLDFGLARVMPGAASLTQSAPISGPSALVGTVPYMSPEQVRDGRVDASSDLYALGALLFEMTTGRRPFSGDDVLSLLYQIAHEPAPLLRVVRPGLSAELEAVVARCLEKAPLRRFSDAGALLRALRGDSSDDGRGLPTRASSFAGRAPESGTGKGIQSLVVLPFENRSGDPAQEFFADGMTDALIADLAQIAALRVISRTSAMRFKGIHPPLSELARDLRVDGVVEGSALRVGDRVRITVQLVDVASDRSLWAKSYERGLTDILALQSEVAHAIADEIRIQVTPDERARLRSKGAVNPAAHVAYLQGSFLWNRFTGESVKEAIRRYEEALAIDPNYAAAYGGLADSYIMLANHHILPPREGYSLGRKAAERGLLLDESLAEAPHLARLDSSSFRLGLAGRRARVLAGGATQSRLCVRTKPICAAAIGDGAPRGSHCRGPAGARARSSESAHLHCSGRYSFLRAPLRSLCGVLPEMPRTGPDLWSGPHRSRALAGASGAGRRSDRRVRARDRGA